ncbi:MAG: XRE family transcriptional regulator [Bacillota bacterium]
MSRDGIAIWGHRLTEAREIRGLTMPELAQKIGKTKQTISYYENGTVNPSPATLNDICEALSLPAAFFTVERIDAEIINRPVFYRSMKSALLKQRKQTIRWLQWIVNRVTLYNKYLDFPKVQLPYSQTEWRNLELDDIETVAENTRAAMGLGHGPISNLTLLLENNGIIVVHYDLGKKELDACSTIVGGRPIILINTYRATCSRVLMDLAHELGHILLHSSIEGEELANDDTYKLIESQAWRFASSFLLPADSFAAEIVDTRLSSFAQLKRRWRVSIAAMIMRCYDLMIVDDYRKTFLFTEMSRQHMRAKEPYDDILEIERPRSLFNADNEIMRNSILSKYQLLEDSYLSPNDYEQIIGADDSYFNEVIIRPKLRPQLKIVK